MKLHWGERIASLVQERLATVWLGFEKALGEREGKLKKKTVLSHPTDCFTATVMLMSTMIIVKRMSYRVPLCL